MRVGLCGWSLSGKSTVFDALTGVTGGEHQSGAGKARVGVSHVPDERLDYLATIFKPKKITYATVEYVDLPGLVSDTHAHEANPKILSDVRQADSLIAVIRAFADPSVPPAFGDINPVRDFSRLIDELVFADLEVTLKRIERLEADVNKPTAHQKEDQLQLAALQRIKAALEDGRAASTVELSENEERTIRGFRFLSAKPLLVLLNRGEESVGEAPKWTETDFGRPTVDMFAKLERELSELTGDDRKAFMEDLGLTTLTAPVIIKKGYEILDQISFLTAGDKEVRAWTITRGTPAVEAAGVIHSDIQRGFIRAEITPYEDFKVLGSFKEARAKGKLRLEGKEYVMQDGDIVEFRFSV
jgi:ribosome-binding ATPase